jgi:hypothetical protein
MILRLAQVELVVVVLLKEQMEATLFLHQSLQLAAVEAVQVMAQE